MSRSRKRVPIMPPEEVLRMSEGDVLVCGYTKPIKVQRPKLEVWRSLVNPVPYSWKPLDCELLPIRSEDGKLLDQPAAVGERNPWDAIRHEEPPPPPPPEPPKAKGDGKKAKKFTAKKPAKGKAVAAMATGAPAASGDLFDPFDDSPMVVQTEDENAPPADDDDLLI